MASNQLNDTLNEIAKEAEKNSLLYSDSDRVIVIRSAIDKALEAVLTREPSEIDEMVSAWWIASGFERDTMIDQFYTSECVRAMTAKLIEELRKP